MSAKLLRVSTSAAMPYDINTAMQYNQDELVVPKSLRSIIIDRSRLQTCEQYLNFNALRLTDLNYDVLRNIFDRLDLDDIVSLQRVCMRFEEEAHYRRLSARFELQSVVTHRFGIIDNWLHDITLILQRYGDTITELDADYNCFTGRHNDIEDLSHIVRTFCGHLKIYTVHGTVRLPELTAGQLCRPNFQALHTLRLNTFSSTTTDEDIMLYLSECQGTLRSLHIESMWVTGEFLIAAPDLLESLALIHLHEIDMIYVTDYLERNPMLQRFELVTRGLLKCLPTFGFYNRLCHVEHLKLAVDNRSKFMCPLNVGQIGSFKNLKSLELDVFKMNNLDEMFAGLAQMPVIEQLSITLSSTLEQSTMRALQTFEKLKYLKVNFRTNAAVLEMDNIFLSVGNAVALTDLRVESRHGGNLMGLFVFLPYLRIIKLKMGGYCTNVEAMAFVDGLSEFEVRVAGDGAIDTVNRLVQKIQEQRPMRRLTVTILSALEFPAKLLSGFAELAMLGIESYETADAFELCRIAEGRTFVVPIADDAQHCVRLVTDLVQGCNCSEIFEIEIAGEVGYRYEEYEEC